MNRLLYSFYDVFHHKPLTFWSVSLAVSGIALGGYVYFDVPKNEALHMTIIVAFLVSFIFAGFFTMKKQVEDRVTEEYFRNHGYEKKEKDGVTKISTKNSKNNSF